MSNSERIVDVVSEEAARLGCTLSESETLGLTPFVKLLAHWNQHIRLTGSSNPRQMVREQLADVLVLARCLPGNEAQQCVDVGSGGALPALPLPAHRGAAMCQEILTKVRNPHQGSCSAGRLEHRASRVAVDGARRWSHSSAKGGGTAAPRSYREF